MRDVQLEQLLRISVAVMIVISTTLLSLGDHTPGLALLSLVLVAVSTWACDVRKFFQLSQPLANCAALAIMCVAAYNAFQSDRQGQLLVVAHLQSYLQFVLLFQPKSPRVYWQLALLCLGQVAIASTLIPGPVFGFMLLAFLFAAVVSFSLLVLNTDYQRWAVAGAGSIVAALPPLPATNREGFDRRPVLLGNGSPASPRQALRGTLVLASVVTLLAIAVSSATFFVLPRWQIRNRETSNTTPLRSIGFSKTVTLGELGEVVNNSDVVMRVEFFPGRTNQRLKLAGDPLLRGTVVSEYRDGQWTQGSRKSPAVLPLGASTEFVRQKISIEPMDESELFCVFPVFALQSDPRLRIDGAYEHMMRQDDLRGRLMEFEIGTTGIVGNRQRDILPSAIRLYNMQALLQTPPLRADNSDPLEGLKQTAARVLAERNIDPADRVAAARALNDYLRGSGNFTYSLDAQERNPAADPLEDFVTTNRRGHCEYFAGALVMMLRSQKIPARMAIGFKGGEWNEVGRYYQVQQLHAHTWVEVYLRRDEFPAGAFDEDDLPPGAWLVLDPTASTREGAATDDITTVARFWQYLDYMHVLWANYVVGLNSKRQQQSIYEPLAQAAVSAVDSVISPDVWSDRWHSLSNSHLGAFWQWYRRHWFSWRGGLVAALFSSALALAYTGGKQLLLMLRRLGLVGASGGGRETPVLEMYRRLEAALARQGFQRQPSQTAYEFALAAGGELAEHIEHRRVAHLPRRVVETFHRVRFGGRTLDNSEAQALEHALGELELALGRGR